MDFQRINGGLVKLNGVLETDETEIAQELYGKKYSELTPEQKEVVDHRPREFTMP